MKVNLAAENNNVKDNYPPGNFNIRFKSIEYKSQQQKERIHYNGCVTECYQSTFQPGKWQNLLRSSFMRLFFQIPKNNRK